MGQLVHPSRKRRRIETKRPHLSSIAGVCFLFSPSVGAQAQFIDGNALLSLCRTDADSCRAYVVGVLDGLAENRRWTEAVGSRTALQSCVPEGVTAMQVAEIVYNELVANPYQRHSSAAGIVTYSIQQAFPCKAHRAN
jgi:hypothetical protein